MSGTGPGEIAIDTLQVTSRRLSLTGPVTNFNLNGQIFKSQER